MGKYSTIEHVFSLTLGYLASQSTKKHFNISFHEIYILCTLKLIMTTTGQSFFTKKQTYKAHLWLIGHYALYITLKRMTEQGYIIAGTKHGTKQHLKLSKQAEDIINYYNRSFASYIKEYEKRMFSS